MREYWAEDDWELTPEESAAVDKAFENKNPPKIEPNQLPVRFEVKDADRSEVFDNFVANHGPKLTLPPSDFFYARAMQRSSEIKKQFYESNPALTNDWQQRFERLRDAVSELYYAAKWTPDREVNSTRLWEQVRDAAGFQPGGSPQ